MSKQTKHQARFSQLPRRAVMDTDLSSTDFKVLAIIGLYLNHDLEAWPMQETIGDVGGMSKSTVSRSIKRLEDAGYIISRKKYPNKPGTHKCYAVVLDEAGQDDTPGTVKNDTSENVTDATPELHPGCNSGISSKDATPIRTNPIELTHMNKHADGVTPVDEAFEKIWSVWSPLGRRRSKKIPLLKAQLKRLSEKHDLEEISRAARMYAKTTNGQYHKALNLWLEGGYFENWVAKTPERAREDAQNTDPLAQCFETYAKTGEWFGDRHGWVLKPEHPNAEYPRELYARFGLTKEIAA